LLRATGGAGAMLGRATRGRPDLPGTAFGLLRGGRFERMGKDTLRRTMLDHAGLLCEMLGEVRGMRRFRKHAHWYLRAAGARPDPREAHSLETVAELRALLERCLGP
jgi:tRNA-dihydrouridine synthase